MDFDDDLDIGPETRCEVCDAVMRTADGSYQCAGPGWEIDIPWIERPRNSDNIPAFAEADLSRKIADLDGSLRSPS